MPLSDHAIRDLGELKGELLLFGGCYSNLAALEALFAEARAVGIASDHVICTGDVVGYCAQSAQTVSLMRAHAATVCIAGNVELQLRSGRADCGCGFEGGSQCDLASRFWYAEAARQLDEGSLAWMETLPAGAVFTHGARRYGVLHGGWTDTSRFLWPNSSTAEFVEEISAFEAVAGQVDGIIAGHCGLAFERDVEGKNWINAGVIGLPPHDGREAARYARLGTDGARFYDLSYDANTTAEAMRKTGLTQGYESALESGVWPSEDILPAALRR